MLANLKDTLLKYDYKKLRIFPRKLFIKSEAQLVFVDITKTLKGTVAMLLFLFFIFGYLIGHQRIKVEQIVVKIPTEIPTDTKFDNVIGDMKWKDSIFTDYFNKAKLYLSQEEFKGTPIKADMLSLAAWNTYDKTGIIVPLELALAQAQWESDMGRLGRSPIKNPYNVGEWDNKTVRYFKSTYDGIQAYYDLIATEYLSCKSINDLFHNFTNCSGHRYASKSTYEFTIKAQYYYIQQWFIENYE